MVAGGIGYGSGCAMPSKLKMREWIQALQDEVGDLRVDLRLRTEQLAMAKDTIREMVKARDGQWWRRLWKCARRGKNYSEKNLNG